MDLKKRIDIEIMVYDMIEKIAEEFDPNKKKEFEEKVFDELSDIFDRDFIDDQLQDYYCDNPEWEDEEL